MYKNWEPVDLGQSPEVVSSAAPPAEYSQRFDDVVLGCHAGHPAEIILALTEEVKNITASVTECKLVFKSGVNKNYLVDIFVLLVMFCRHVSCVGASHYLHHAFFFNQFS